MIDIPKYFFVAGFGVGIIPPCRVAVPENGRWSISSGFPKGLPIKEVPRTPESGSTEKRRKRT